MQKRSVHNLIGATLGVSADEQRRFANELFVEEQNAKSGDTSNDQMHKEDSVRKFRTHLINSLLSQENDQDGRPGGFSKFSIASADSLSRLTDADDDDDHDDTGSAASDSTTDDEEGKDASRPSYFHRISLTVERMSARFMRWFSGLLEDLTVTREQLHDAAELYGDVHKTKVSLPAFRKNVKRALEAGRPYAEVGLGLMRILLWKSPFATLTIFLGYMHAVYRGWILSILIALFILQLSLNYLTSRGHKLELCAFPRQLMKNTEINAFAFESSDKSNQGSQLVLMLVQRAQVLLEKTSDVLERLKNLAMWKKPDVSLRLYAALWLAFFGSFVISTSHIMMILGWTIGIYLFVNTYLFYRFPKVRHRIDPVTVLLDKAPPDYARRKRPIYAITAQEVKRASEQHDLTAANHLGGSNFFAQKRSEMPFGMQMVMPRIARKCILLDRDLSFPHAIGSGVLEVYETFVFFRYRRKDEKGERQRMNIRLVDITAIKKCRSIDLPLGAILPGNNNALQIFAHGRERPYLFCGIKHRDKCHSILIELGLNAGLEWALD